MQQSHRRHTERRQWGDCDDHSENTSTDELWHGTRTRCQRGCLRTEGNEVSSCSSTGRTGLHRPRPREGSATQSAVLHHRSHEARDAAGGRLRSGTQFASPPRHTGHTERQRSHSYSAPPHSDRSCHPWRHRTAARDDHSTCNTEVDWESEAEPDLSGEPCGRWGTHGRAECHCRLRTPPFRPDPEKAAGCRIRCRCTILCSPHGWSSSCRTTGTGDSTPHTHSATVRRCK